MANEFDLIVLGSGPGGYVAAIRASQLGLKTAIVERENLGGICLNWGCIPTKALLRSAEILHYAEHAKAYGLKLDGTVSADTKAVVERSRGVSARLNGGVGFLMKKNKVDVIWGEAKITKPGEIVVGGTGQRISRNRFTTPGGLVVRATTGSRIDHNQFSTPPGPGLGKARHSAAGNPDSVTPGYNPTFCATPRHIGRYVHGTRHQQGHPRRQPGR